MTDKWDIKEAEKLVDPLVSEPGALIEAMHRLQATFGYIDKAAIPMLAERFNLSRAEVFGVFSFYHDFRDNPHGKYVIKVCQAEACRSMGSDAITAEVKSLLGIDFHETTASGLVSLEPVYCLGNCALAPALMVNETPYGRVSADKAKALIGELE